MIDPAVERQYSDSKELLGLWRTFHDFFVMGVKGESITPEKEAQFLEIKSRIAMLHDSFMDALTHDANIGQEVLNIISRAITLKHLGKQSTADIKKMEIEWHESYLLLNETIGALEDKRSELAKINKTQFRASKSAAVARQKTLTFLNSFYFKLTVVLTVVLFGTVGIQTLGIYDYNQLGKQSWAIGPYQMGKAVVRKIFPDSPYITIETLPRKPFMSWPSGFKAPEKKSEDQKKAAAKVPIPTITSKLEKATEFMSEETSKQMKGTFQIYWFLFPDTQPVKDIMTEWEPFAANEKNRTVVEKVRLRAFANCIVMVTGPNSENVQLLWENMF